MNALQTTVCDRLVCGPSGQRGRHVYHITRDGVTLLTAARANVVQTWPMQHTRVHVGGIMTQRHNCAPWHPMTRATTLGSTARRGTRSYDSTHTVVWSVSPRAVVLAIAGCRVVHKHNAFGIHIQSIPPCGVRGKCGGRPYVTSTMRSHTRCYSPHTRCTFG